MRQADTGIPTTETRKIDLPTPAQTRTRPNSLSSSEWHARDESLRLFIDGVEDYAIFMLDREGRVATWNAGAQRAKGYRASEIVGRHFSVFYSEEDRRAGRAEKLLRIATEQGRVSDEGWRVRRDGTVFWASVTITAIRDEKRQSDRIREGNSGPDRTQEERRITSAE